MAVEKIAGSLDGTGLRIGVVVSRFNEYAGKEEFEACLQELINLGVDEEDITHVSVPGALEIPFALEHLAESGSFDADEERKTIHVNVGYDTYGWEVQFSDGVVMNLRDVREYQIRNGRLPSADGRIIYGQSILAFSGVERIVVYKSVKYFSYGI